MPGLTEMRPEFVWSRSSDNDPLDTVEYRLHLSLDRNFDFAWISAPLLDTTGSRTDSLEFSERYWWKVTAEDRTLLVSESAIDSFWTWTLGDADNSHTVDVADLSFLVDYLFKSGSAPCDLLIGDTDGNCAVNVSDLTYLVNFLLKGGPVPVPCP